MLLELDNYYSNNGVILQQSNANHLKVYINAVSKLDISHTIPEDEWVHIALVRNSGILTLYENGVSLGSTSDSSTISQGDFTIAADNYNSQTETLDGSIDEFRFSNGIARWTTTFTPPTEEYAAIDDIVIAEPLIGTFSLNSAGASTGDIVTAEPLTGTFSLSSSGGRVWDGIVHTEPFVGTFSLSADARLIQRTLFNSTFILINSLKIGSTLSIVNSLNTQLTSNIDLKLSILQNLEANFGIKMTIEELSKFNDTVSLLNHIFDTDSGITQGQFYFLKSHGL